MTFEEWWQIWWHENELAARDSEQILKENARAAWNSGHGACWAAKRGRPDEN